MDIILCHFFTYKYNCRQNKDQKPLIWVSWDVSICIHWFHPVSLSFLLARLLKGLLLLFNYSMVQGTFLGAYYSPRNIILFLLILTQWFLFLFCFVSLAFCRVGYFLRYLYYISQDLKSPHQKRWTNISRMDHCRITLHPISLWISFGHWSDL